jgi:hypothetical protein
MDYDSATVYERWDFHQRFQHWLIMLSFFLLARHRLNYQVRLCPVGADPGQNIRLF